jgi:hypothetical protein
MLFSEIQLNWSNNKLERDAFIVVSLPSPLKSTKKSDVCDKKYNALCLHLK